ncbi:hypothetical protein DSL72_007504 [Monilinia vaccinii-corymbosi]|uniref:Carboxylic ester hydrolase n=1 Tax=Monilinia vaccinii-corymbosi TaxID=61207 RepID=A0A8A3PHU9_9HELO|nr:hypothetical protein DSL72_007504 [Monilinia vaccinii-corymbosi]
MKFSLILPTLHLLSIAFALPIEEEEGGGGGGKRAAAAAPIVKITSPAATIIGEASTTIETFTGIPFAQPPTGALRLKPPEPITAALGTIHATTQAASCPQFYFSDAINGAIPTSALGLLLDTPILQEILHAGEDCLYLNIQRPAGTNASSGLPVLFWIFGGGFELGGTAMYDGSSFVAESVAEGKPIIFVAVAYRVGGFGFLPGAEVLADGSANLGLLDQRLGLQWVSDNIAAFGGDPSKVTIWGESAGAISVFDQMVLYGGDNTYKGKALFRGAIMHSGSIVPADPVDCLKGQVVYDTVVASAGCSTAKDSLACLRGVPYHTLLNATNSVPGLLSYSSIALSYLPRPDGKVLTQSPDLLLSSGAWAKVPFIIGDQEDEGTLFALFQSNISTTAQLATYLSDIFFPNTPASLITALLRLYPNDLTSGSPFRTSLLNNWYPQFKRLAAILGDLTFTLTRRILLRTVHNTAPTLPTWSFLSSYDHAIPILGTYHASDVRLLFSADSTDYAARATRAYYLSFIHILDPNNGTSSTYATWPPWGAGNQLLNLFADSASFITDDFRSASSDFLSTHLTSFHI